MSRPSPPPWLIPAALVAAAFGVRLVYLLQIESIPLFYYPTMDEGYHVTVARQILGGALPAEPYYRAPGYLYFLAGLFRLTGSDLFWTRFLQLLLGSTLPLFVWLAGRRLFSDRIALAAAIVTVVYPTLIYYDAQLLITTVKVFLVTLLVWQLYRTQKRLTLPDFVMSGLILGVAGVFRPNILMIGPALAVWAYFVMLPQLGWRATLVRYAAMGFAAVIAVAPVTVRNYIVGGEPVLIAWQGGFNFYLGNNANATGWSATAPGIDQSWMGGYRQAIAIAEHDAGRSLKRSAVSEYWYERGWDDIRRAPWAFAGLAFKKLRLFFNGYEIPNNQDIYLAREYSWLLRPLYWHDPFPFPYGLLAPLGLLGIGLSLNRWRRYLLVYLVAGAYIGSFLFFFVCARYRQPIVPILILFACFAVAELAGMVRRRRYGTLAICAVIFAGLVLESNHDMLGLDQKRVDSNNHNLLGNAYFEQGSTILAAAEFSRAVAADPTNAEAHNNAGMMAARRGSRREAQAHFVQAIRLDPYEMGSYYNLATVKLEDGDPAAAIGVLEQARSVRPFDDFVHLKLAMTYLEVGRLPEAMASVNESLRLNPDSDLAPKVKADIARAMQAAGHAPPP